MDQLSHVINYELPNIPETYVHRIGRTGRAGHDGIALSFCESEELPYLKDIQKLIGKSIPVIKEHPFVTADGLKAQKIKTEEIKAKTKENKIYRGSRTNGDFWRRKSKPRKTTPQKELEDKDNHKKTDIPNKVSKKFVSFVVRTSKERNIIMKGLNVLAAFLGGAAVGAALGILFAPEKGEDTRNKIAEILRKKGIRLNRSEMEDLVDEIAAEIKGEVTE